MSGKKIYKDRYPGLQPFDKNQAAIFFGREREKKELYYQVCLEKLVVLFGKSGLGKSSLLNAGLSPLLEKNGYLPIRVRFSSPARNEAPVRSESATVKEEVNLLVRDFIIAFDGFKYKRHIVWDKKNPRLWEYIKARQFTDVDGRTLTPVFIFDQFEEFFYHPVAHQQEFLQQLSEVVHNETPSRILEWIVGINLEERTPSLMEWHTQPAVKVIFALRSDKLANMQSIVPYIHTVLRTRYELKPLTTEQAKEAIEQPAREETLGPEYTPPFDFDPDTLDQVVGQLSKGSDEIESSQLQIVCNFIENKVRKEQETKGQARIKVDNTIINPEKDFPDILDNFYEDQLALIINDNERELARKLIEDELVIDGQRDSLSERKIINILGIKKELITELLNTRLIRGEESNRGISYEVSHDTLIAPIEKAKSRRLEEDQRVKLLEEREKLVLETKQKDAELKKQQEQLEREMRLKEEAHQQKERAERLSRKVRSRGIWVTVLLFGLLVTAVFLFNDSERALNRRNRQVEHLDTLTKELENSNTQLEQSTDSLVKSIVEQVEVTKNDSTQREKAVDSLIQKYKIPQNRAVRLKQTVVRDHRTKNNAREQNQFQVNPNNQIDKGTQPYNPAIKPDQPSGKYTGDSLLRNDPKFSPPKISKDT